MPRRTTTTTATDLWRTLRSDKEQWHAFVAEVAAETYRVMEADAAADGEKWRNLLDELVACVIDELHRQADEIKAKRPTSKKPPRTKQ